VKSRRAPFYLWWQQNGAMEPDKMKRPKNNCDVSNELPGSN
jgi:hypothetical protein